MLRPALSCSFYPKSPTLLSLSRLLEEGNPDAAEEQKQRIEQLQRERRRVLQENNMTHKPRFFMQVILCSICRSYPDTLCGVKNHY